jgi:hypothetical protein
VLQPFRFLFHADTWPVFLCVLTGLFTGHTTLACVRASLLTANVKWHQCCDFYRRARWSRTAFLRATTSLVLHTLYPEGLPARLWWVADTTTSDKPSAKQVFGIRRFWRGCRRPGQAPVHQGHGWVLLAHLYQRPDRSWQALLVGALLWLQLRRAAPGRLTAALVAQLGLPAQVSHVLVSDRGLSSRELVRALCARGCHSVTRLRRNTVVYTPAPPKLVDDSEYLIGVEAHKRAYAHDLQATMLPAGNLRGYFEVPTDEGWKLLVDLSEKRLELVDAWGLSTAFPVTGDLAPFVWAYKHCGFCLLTLFDKDIKEIRDDLLFVAKRQGVELRWRRTAA